ncbi:hypothetical protein ES706_00014 [subsurface metagenome]|nr:hypothetical protein [Hadesarchaea archaeon]
MNSIALVEPPGKEVAGGEDQVLDVHPIATDFILAAKITCGIFAAAAVARHSLEERG